MQIAVLKKGSVFFSPADELDMYRLRFQMFRERLNWDVDTEDGLEFDEYDDLDPHYLIAKDEQMICGCWRILPTIGPNMLRDVFPELLAGLPAPCGEDIWELSRFAVNRQRVDGFGFSRLPLSMMAHTVRFARSQGVNQLVTVTTTALERLLKHAGLAPRRMGPALQIGVERTVALAFDLDAAMESALAGAARERGVNRATNIV